MENLNIQEQQPVSTIEQQKKEAGIFVTERIVALSREKGVSNLEAVRMVYEEVKGHDYRKEQASAKLLEYLNMANEVAQREEELKHIYPEMGSVITTRTSANDDKYLIAA